MATNVAQPIAEKARLIRQAERECSAAEAAVGADAAGGRCCFLADRREGPVWSLEFIKRCIARNSKLHWLVCNLLILGVGGLIRVHRAPRALQLRRCLQTALIQEWQFCFLHRLGCSALEK